jgi:hypothetical protein
LTLITQKSKTLYSAAGFFQLSNLQTACHSPNLAKIQEMKGISEPLLPMVMYTIYHKLSLEEYRKYFTGSIPKMQGRLRGHGPSLFLKENSPADLGLGQSR